MTRRYRKKFRSRRKPGKKKFYLKAKKSRRSKQILKDSDWRSMYRFERRHGVLRGTKFPRI